MSRLQFKFDYEKCIQVMQFLAQHSPEITQYYVGKVMFFADREHLLDWGRPICGDRYVAMEHGPVPSNAYDLMKDGSGEPDEVVDTFAARLTIRTNGNKKHLSVRADAPSITALSESDKDYLLRSLHQYGHMSFSEIKAISHRDRAYEDAWAKVGLNNEMNLRLWLNEEQNRYINEISDVQKAC